MTIKYFKNLFLASVLFTVLFSCDTQIFPEIPDGSGTLVIDAWLDNSAKYQILSVSRTSSFYAEGWDNGIADAVVYILDQDEDTIKFEHDLEIADGQQGFYKLDPDISFEIGKQYSLFITVDDETFLSTTTIYPTTEIDSLDFELEDDQVSIEDTTAIIFGTFFAWDLGGEGNTYWIKTYKNHTLLNKPSEINIAYDGGFSPGGAIDSIIFIPPIRNAVNPFESDPDDPSKLLKPYDFGDTMSIEIHSISNEAFDFLNQLRIQTDRQGGFAELFAEPLNNLPSNFRSTDENSNTSVLGFFNIAAISERKSKVLLKEDFIDLD